MSYLQNKSIQTLIRNLILMVFLLLFVSVNTVSASILSEQFNASNSDIRKGSIVSLRGDETDEIELSNLTNSEYLLGVVADSGDSVVTYVKDNSNVTVSLAGEVDVFVNNANGDIEQGDFIGASWLEGVGMKATTSDQQKLLGVALESFSASEGAEYGEIETASGKKSVQVGSIPVRLFEKEGVTEYGASQDGLDSVLNNIAGREVSFARIITSSVIFVSSVVLAGFFVSSSIKGSFVSIGRNPMASDSIYKSLTRMTLMSVAIILIGTTVTYVVLVL